MYLKIKAIGFDIGGTLVNYNKPLNWSASYEDAIQYMCENSKIALTEEKLNKAKEILWKYNTRANPREKEVSSQIIFEEIFEKWNEKKENIAEAKKFFFAFFQREAILYNDVKIVLEYCKTHSIKCCVYTDVAYGMDDDICLKDIEKISDYIDLKLTSLNVGYRKPNKRGFELMLEHFSCEPQEMIFVGDELKDIQGAKKVGMKTILIDREEKHNQFEQDYTVSSLTDVVNIIESESDK